MWAFVIYEIDLYSPFSGNLLPTKQKKRGTGSIMALLAILLEEVQLYNAVRVKTGQMIYSL